MSNDKTITETLPVLNLKVHFMGMGWQCECESVEDIRGMSSTYLGALCDFISRYAERNWIEVKDIKFSVQ